jgi:hypothetical protein
MKSFSSVCRLVAALNSGHSPSFGFLHPPWSWLPASHFSQLQLSTDFNLNYWCPLYSSNMDLTENVSSIIVCCTVAYLWLLAMALHVTTQVAVILIIFTLLSYLISNMTQCHVRWVPLSPQHGASSGCGWKGRPPALEVSCEYIE